jgi:hypothetical protein
MRSAWSARSGEEEAKFGTTENMLEDYFSS